jgi:protein associated with RNAse G/E
MPETDESPGRVRRFAAGATAVRRDVLRGGVWTAAPMRVIHDRPGELLLAYWPGIEGLASTIQIESLLTGDDAVRKQAIPALAEGRWELGRWTWRDTLLLTWLDVDEDFGVCRFLRTESGRETWYINFQRPYRRTRIGVDTFDLLLDLVVAPDRSRWDWKDEDEYAQGRRLGLIGDEEHRRIERARERAVALVESGGGPLAQDWSAWRVPPSWPYPALPEDTLDVPAA